MTDFHDDDLRWFEAHGAPSLPAPDAQGHVDHDGARIWYATYGASTGTGVPVVLLHGGLGHAGNWGHQLPMLVDAGHRVVLVDSRGHGRSTRDARPFRYERMAADVLAVLDAVHVERAAAVGWSDGACVALILAMQAPTRVAGVLFFACNMDPSGTREIVPAPILDRCLARHARDYAALSPTPDDFAPFAAAVGEMMRTQPNYGRRELATVRTPVAIVQAEHDEFIRPEHAEHLARCIPGAELIVLPAVSHFAPLQRPARFHDAVQGFLARIAG